MSRIIGGIGDFFSALTEIVQGIFENLVNLPSQIIDLLVDALKLLFVPSDNYFSSNFDSIKALLESHLSLTSFKSLMEIIQNAKAGTLPDLKIKIFGVDYVLFSFKFFDPYIPTIQYWIKGFLGALLVLYNINQVYKLVRGGSLQDGVSGKAGD